MRYLVNTDLEPDDRVAIIKFLNELNQSNETFEVTFITGAGLYPSAKVAQMNKILEMAKLDPKRIKVKVVKGSPLSKFPDVLGYDLLGKWDVNANPPIYPKEDPSTYSAEAVSATKDFLKDKSSKGIILSLAGMKDILKATQELETDEEIVKYSHIDFFGSMSYNFRVSCPPKQVGEKRVKDVAPVLNMLAKFNTQTWYETYYSNYGINSTGKLFPLNGEFRKYLTTTPAGRLIMKSSEFFEASNYADCIETLFDISDLKDGDVNCIGLTKNDHEKAKRAKELCEREVEKVNNSKANSDVNLDEEAIKDKMNRALKDFKQGIADILGADIMNGIESDKNKKAKWANNFVVLCNMLFLGPQICSSDLFFMTAFFNPELYQVNKVKVNFNDGGSGIRVQDDNVPYQAEIPYITLDFKLDTTNFQLNENYLKEHCIVTYDNDVLDTDMITIDQASRELMISGVALSKCVLLDKAKVLRFEKTMVAALEGPKPEMKMQGSLALSSPNFINNNNNNNLDEDFTRIYAFKSS